MIVKKEESSQYSIFPVNKPLYRNCKTCARLVPNGKCEYCGVNEYTTRTPWKRMNELKQKKKRGMNRKDLVELLLEKYKNV